MIYYFAYVVMCLVFGAMLTVNNIANDEDGPYYPLFISSFFAFPPLFLLTFVIGWLYQKYS